MSDIPRSAGGAGPSASLDITARAPNRIDLAGGTLDIWPLYLLMEGGLTVNLAVTVHSEVRLESAEASGYEIVSSDTGLRERAGSLDGLDPNGPLGLIARVVRHFAPPPGLRVTTHNQAPKGSGLGASSSLLVALIGAFERLTGRAPSTSELVNLAADLEVQTIRVPTGKQDYYAAVCGGANAIWFEPGRNRVESLPLNDSFAQRLLDSMVLSFTGQSHFSAPTNWLMMKGYIEGRPVTHRGLDRIKETSLAMRQAWLGQDIDALGDLLGQEWDSRRELAEGVSTPVVERAMAVACAAGASASKICGAGGGGCMVSLTPEGRAQSVAAALTEAGYEVLEFDFDREGLTVRG